LSVVAALGVMLGALLVAGPASATPKGAFAVFAECPVKTAGVEGCLYSKTESGEVVLGKQAVPITNPIVLQAGFYEVAGEEDKLVAAAGGNTLTKSPQNVPGGLLDFVNCKEISNIIERVACEVTFENGVTGVSATTELAVPASSIKFSLGSLIEEKGTALTLPVKVHLENPFLGSECYIGSNSNPLTLTLTTGTTSPPAPNKPIKGKSGNLEFPENGEIDQISGVSLVNNSFSAPGASGCGGGLLSLLIDPIINSKLGLPAASGHNTAILNGKMETAGVEEVKAHE